MMSFAAQGCLGQPSQPEQLPSLSCHSQGFACLLVCRQHVEQLEQLLKLSEEDKQRLEQQRLPRPGKGRRVTQCHSLELHDPVEEGKADKENMLQDMSKEDHERRLAAGVIALWGLNKANLRRCNSI